MPQVLVRNGKKEWESKINWSQRLSRKALLQTKVKNQHEHNRLGFRMKQLQKNQDLTDLKQERELKVVRDQYRRMVASSYVYREHSFDKYDPFLRPKSETKRDMTRIPGYTYIRMWRQNKKGDDKDDDDKSDDDNRNSHNQHLKQLQSVDTQRQRSMSSRLDASRTGTADSPPKVSLSQKWKAVKASVKADDHSVISSKPENKATKSNQAGDVFQTFMTNSVFKNFDTIKIRRLKRKEKTFTYSRDRTIFAGACKSTYQMRKFIEKEVSKTMFSLSPEGQYIANIDRLKEQAKLPDFVDRSKSMSAILRRYKSYKERDMLATA